ncbi:pirin family protein [Sphaerochaeta globosa]|uniref:Pirin domain protein n=1 Tax=Sphaerochaeta globosa (strain ATCC BAA-1886 / DSM 22777 / Buddy) TaxID=158189 RepID=F0RRX5_SPHGB|nr:pirin family protein [Sphaerochaeta globosa]ADY14580.1 Pirin domain protein [Sphaerochaeta globosa str. Buddy]
MQLKPIKRITGGTVQYDGAGVKLVRIIGYNDVQKFDPFLMLDAFDSSDPKDYLKGFPWHPHRGIETVTYLIEGEIEHGDSMGNIGSINNGCCQWMTGGSGIIHQEMPKTSPLMLGTQLWINLPKKDKMTDPAYRDIRESQIPVVRAQGSEVRIISGFYEGKSGAEQGDYVKTLYLDIKLEANIAWDLSVNPTNTLFIYIVRGSVHTDNQEVPFHRAVLFGEGDTLSLKAGSEGARIFLYSAKPLGEPIAWAGPIVMNTREELTLAQRELREGTFIKHT